MSRFVSPTIFLFAIALASLLLNSYAHAGNFEVSPIRVDFDSTTRSSVLTIRNVSSDESVVVQARIVKWTQSNGEDVTATTTDLIVNPPIFTLTPNGTQLVRLGPRDAALAQGSSNELSYRIILSEVPKAPTPDFRGVGIALNLSVPVFFAPNGSADQPLPEIVTSRDAEGRVVATVTNSGTKSFKVTKLALTNTTSKETLEELTQVRYLLPGSKATWSFKPKLPAPANFSVSITSERGVHSVDIKETRVGILSRQAPLIENIGGDAVAAKPKQSGS